MLRRTLREKNPPEFSCSWIAKHNPVAYRFICKKVRNEIEAIDWDRATVVLSRRHQKRWIRYQCRLRREYEDPVELEKVLGKCRDKLYIFIAASTVTPAPSLMW
jgi:hypothetical protein